MQAPFIQNIPKKNVALGWHIEPGVNSMLIQIVDPHTKFPEPKYKFKEIHQFQFLDTEEGFGKITDEDAAKIAALLRHALANHMTVITHCHAGVCRSGAVVEAGMALGFRATDTYRSPNRLVKHKILEKLGLPFDPNEPYTENGIPFIYDELNNKHPI